MHFRPRLLCGEIVYVFRLDGIVRGAASLACGAIIRSLWVIMFPF